jgi:hypothetical protein
MNSVQSLSTAVMKKRWDIYEKNVIHMCYIPDLDRYPGQLHDGDNRTDNNQGDNNGNNSPYKSDKCRSVC